MRIGRADYLALGDWNIACSMCGRKRKASQMVKNWQGYWRCPWHNEPRQTQDFVRGVKDIQTVPFVQPQTNTFVTFSGVFPLTITPATLALSYQGLSFATLSGNDITTLGGALIGTISTYTGYASAGFPSWVTPVSFAWSWASGGVGITIDTPAAQGTFFTTSSTGNSGIAQCVSVNSLGQTGTATIQVTS